MTALRPPIAGYRALLDVSAAIGEQPTVKALSSKEIRATFCPVAFASMALTYTSWTVVNKLCTFLSDREADAPAIRIGTKISRIGAAAQALEQQKPVFLPDISQEMLKHPELAPFAAQSVGRSAYIFPVFISQQQYGLLVGDSGSGVRNLCVKMSNYSGL